MQTPRLPDFFIIGAPRCGTTALFDYLSHHRSVFMPRMKEPHYFSKDFPGHRQVRDLESYLALFSDAPPSRQIGEASVWYLFSGAAVAEIVKVRPDAKFIVMLRNPVEVAHSLHATLLIQMNEDISDFEKAWRVQAERAAGRRLPFHTTEPSLIQYGKVCSFSHQLERLFHLVPKDRILILLYEEFFADPALHYQEVLRFLGLSPHDGIDFRRINSGRIPANPKMYRFLSSPPLLLRLLLRPLRHLSRRFNLHLGSFMHKLAQRAFRPRDGKTDRMSKAFEKELYEFFAEDVARLERLLGRNLDIWRRGR